MSFRGAIPPPAAFQNLMDLTVRRVEQAERMSMWNSAVRVDFGSSFTSTPGAEEMTTPGYPTYTHPTVALTLDPGRWIILYRATLAIAATDGGEVGMRPTASFDGSTTTTTTRAGGTVTGSGFGDAYTLSSAMEVKSASQISVSLPIFWGYQPLVTPFPFLSWSVFAAAIIAFPG